uniref:ADAM metallopeptidase domain 8 n=1 Tax=Lynx canadensis TaxID=61383 RepID=A0A667GT67_LYNCA
MRRLGLPLFALWVQVAVPSVPLPHVEQYEVVWPQRLPRPRARRALPSHSDRYPESVSYVLGAQGHNFTLHLRKNRELVGSGYTETYSMANGSQVAEQPQRQDHCFYQGHVEGHEHSAASLSTCAGLRGFFRAGSTVHLIEPLDGASEEGRHALYQAEHLQQKAGTCGVSDSSLEKALGPRISAAFRPRNWLLPRETRYVELYVVTDSTEFQLLGSREAVRRRVLEVVNHVDKLYQELNVRVVLVGLEIWNHRDGIHVSSHANTTLENFLTWRAQKLAGRYQHDNAQLITGVDFTGTTVGLAKVSSMCSRGSGAVNQDHHQNPIGVASTMAHEMGHNLGMAHDENIQGCYCPVPREGGGCVMAASIGVKFPRMFSQCSRADLELFVEKPRTGCLDNAPDPGRLVGDPVCGNWFVERGEQCDCGPPQDCRNPCCNATTCRLAHGAECAQGACCRECRVTPAGELCRHPKDACDLEEHCDGQQPGCPEDAFQENGTPCPGGYCYNGACPTLAQRCQDLWGPGSRAAVETCYTYSISPDCRGRIPLGSSRVNRCGVLYCEGGQKPPEQSSCTLTSSSAACQALVLEEGVGYEPVPEGTKCGEERVSAQSPPTPFAGGHISWLQLLGDFEGCEPGRVPHGSQAAGPTGPKLVTQGLCTGTLSFVHVVCSPFSWASPPKAPTAPLEGWGQSSGPGGLAGQLAEGIYTKPGCRDHSQSPPKLTGQAVGQLQPTLEVGVQGLEAALEWLPEETLPALQICWKGRCEHLQVYRSRNCSAQCNNHGVCNHKDECQCHPGWAPPHCTELLPSVHTGSRSLLMVVLVPAVLLVALALLAGAVIYRKASGRNPWGTAAPKTAIGLSNPLFHEGRGVPAKGGAPGPPHHPSQPARPAVPRATPKQPPPAVSTASRCPQWALEAAPSLTTGLRAGPQSRGRL